MNSACNCCEMPTPVGIVLQFTSFDRACSNTCILRYGEPDASNPYGTFGEKWDWLTGPFFTALTASGGDSRTFSTDDKSYTSNWSRTTSAFLELVDFHDGNMGPYECPCTHGYSDTQSSDRTYVVEGEDNDGRKWRYETSMNCNGGGEMCPMECPPYLSPIGTVESGAAGPATITYTSIDTQIPYSEDNNYVTTVNCTCEEPCQCPVPYPWNDTFPDGLSEYIEPSSFEFHGQSPACGFASEDKVVRFPTFPTILKLTPSPLFDSGFIEEKNFDIPQNQGYATTTFRYVRGQGGRYMQQSEQHVKWRIAHNPTATCYLKVWFVKKKTVSKAKLGKLISFEKIITWEDAGFYEWDGGGEKTCIKNERKNFAQVENIIYGPENIMDIPQPNISNREYGIEEEIFIKKVSVIKNYEPPNPPSNSAPPERAEYGFASHDLSIHPLDCLQCGFARSQGGSGSEAWWCAYKFLPLPDGCVTET